MINNGYHFVVSKELTNKHPLGGSSCNRKPFSFLPSYMQSTASLPSFAYLPSLGLSTMSLVFPVITFILNLSISWFWILLLSLPYCFLIFHTNFTPTACHLLTFLLIHAQLSALYVQIGK